MIELGDTLTFSSDLKDAPGGSLVNATSAVLTITLPPDPVTGISATVTPSVTNPPATQGKYLVQYPTTTQTGRYIGRWLFTLANGFTSSYSQVFEVRAGDAGLIISLDDAKLFLDIPATDTTHDEELRGWLAGITRVVENRVGAVIPRTVVDRLIGDRGWTYTPVIRLRQYPVIAVTGMTPSFTNQGGTTYTQAQLQVTPEGRLTRVNGLGFNLGPWDITYRVGLIDIPDNITHGVKIILDHLWETQRGAGSAAFRGGDDTSTPPGFGFAVPNRALEMLEPDDLGPSVG